MNDIALERRKEEHLRACLCAFPVSFERKAVHIRREEVEVVKKKKKNTWVLFL
jgi:hypothetical protein